MLYPVKLYADQQALGFGDKRIEIMAGDAAQAWNLKTGTIREPSNSFRRVASIRS